MAVKNVLDVNLELLDDYREMLMLNPGNWDILSYLNLKFDINAAIAFSKLYFPDFIVKQDCIILGFLYDEVIFNQWYEKLNGDITSVESMCNMYDLMDFFGLNRAADQSTNQYNLLLDEFGKILKKSWEVNSQILFPNRKMVVDVYDEYETTRITIYTKSK